MELLGRLYGLDGCPHCEIAMAFFAGANVPVQPMPINNDPVISEGLKKIQGREDIQVPALVSFVTEEVIVGAKFEDYQRIVAAYRAKLSDSSSGVPANSGGDSQPPSAVAAEKEPISVEVAAVQ
jgi:glutaredoxin